MSAIPLRWIHMTEPGECMDERTLGVYVHVADVLHVLDTQGEEQLSAGLAALLDELSQDESASP